VFSKGKDFHGLGLVDFRSCIGRDLLTSGSSSFAPPAAAPTLRDLVQFQDRARGRLVNEAGSLKAIDEHRPVYIDLRVSDAVPCCS
jgi:hypothetical protein